MMRGSTAFLALPPSSPVSCFTLRKSSIGSISIVPFEPSMRRWRRDCVPLEQTVTVQVVRGHFMSVNVWLGVPSGSPGAGISHVRT